MTDSAKSPIWSDHDIQMINTVDVFLHKPAIMKKVEQRLNDLNQALIAELATDHRNFPDGIDVIKGQIARGENHKGFPFISLDMPQFFTKQDMFTFRTLFWWGHCLVFSLILKGDKLSHYLDTLLQQQQEPAWQDTHIAITPTPWEWNLSTENYIELPTQDIDYLQKQIKQIQFIKLCRFYPANSPSFATMNWTTHGLAAWKDLSGIHQ
jgi:hypothetical protein